MRGMMKGGDRDRSGTEGRKEPREGQACSDRWEGGGGGGRERLVNNPVSL